MFINHTNHLLNIGRMNSWQQLINIGEVVDIPFPLIDPALPSGELGS